MHVFPLATLDREPSDPANFTGPGSLRRIEGALPADPRVNVYRVHFEARSRTNWHTHSGHQMLFIVEGRCRYQKEGEPVGEAGPGDLIVVEPGEVGGQRGVVEPPATEPGVEAAQGAGVGAAGVGAERGVDETPRGLAGRGERPGRGVRDDGISGAGPRGPGRVHSFTITAIIGKNGKGRFRPIRPWRAAPGGLCRPLAGDRLALIGRHELRPCKSP